MKFDDLSNKIIGCAIEGHRELGPGLLESTYEQCLAYELSRAKIPFKVQVGPSTKRFCLTVVTELTYWQTIG